MVIQMVPFVYTGFKPSFYCREEQMLVVKVGRFKTLATNHIMKLTIIFFAQSTGSTFSGYAQIDFLSNGFKIRSSDAQTNGSGDTYIFMAFAENPFVSSGGTPVTAR